MTNQLPPRTEKQIETAEWQQGYRVGLRDLYNGDEKGRKQFASPSDAWLEGYAAGLVEGR